MTKRVGFLTLTILLSSCSNKVSTTSSPLSEDQKAELNKNAQTIDDNKKQTKLYAPKFIEKMSDHDLVFTNATGSSCYSAKKLPGDCVAVVPSHTESDAFETISNAKCTPSFSAVLASDVTLSCLRADNKSCAIVDNVFTFDGVLNKDLIAKTEFSNHLTKAKLEIKAPGYCLSEFSKKKPSDSTPQTGENLNVVGKWSTGCKASDDGGSKKETVEFHEATATRVAEVFGDKACSEPLAATTIEVSYVIPNKTAKTLKLDAVVKSYKMTLKDGDTVSAFNDEEVCGNKNWQKDIEKDLSLVTCSESLKKDTKVYDLMTIENNALFFGFKSGPIPTKEGDRPTIIDDGEAFQKQ